MSSILKNKLQGVFTLALVKHYVYTKNLMSKVSKSNGEIRNMIWNFPCFLFFKIILDQTNIFFAKGLGRHFLCKENKVAMSIYDNTPPHKIYYYTFYCPITSTLPKNRFLWQRCIEEFTIPLNPLLSISPDPEFPWSREARTRDFFLNRENVCISYQLS